MNSILNIGKTGLHAVQRKMDGISEDIANVNTYGYKKKEVNFQELLINQMHENDVYLSDNANNTSINMGTKSSLTSVNFEQGTIVDTPREFDMAIEGQGFFGVLDEVGNLFLSRNGNFHLNPDGTITDNNGYYLNINYEIFPEEWEDGKVNISPNGEIMQQLEDGETMQETVDGQVYLGRIVLYNPSVLDSLVPLGEGRYLPDADVEIYNSIDYEEGFYDFTDYEGDFGNIRQYALESSNVDMAKSFVDMITSQRSYSLNLKTVQTTDDIMSMINNIK